MNEVIHPPDYPVLTPNELQAHFQAWLPVWVVYGPVTSDYPGLWVARLHLSFPHEQATQFMLTHKSLTGLRDLLPAGLTRINRHADDDPVIQEVWI